MTEPLAGGDRQPIGYLVVDPRGWARGEDGLYADDPHGGFEVRPFTVRPAPIEVPAGDRVVAVCELDDGAEPAAVQRVRALHFRGEVAEAVVYLTGVDNAPRRHVMVAQCDHCRRPWPCPTIRALDGV